jgi:hypothetical protein
MLTAVDGSRLATGLAVLASARSGHRRKPPLRDAISRAPP